MVALASPSLGRVLHDVVGTHASADGRRWLERAAAAGTTIDRGAFMEVFTVVARHLGTSALDLAADETTRLEALGVDWPLCATLDELGRIALLGLAASRLSLLELEPLVEDCYQHGDTRERRAVLRALPFLPESERLLAIAVDACRSHVQPLFEAIACENPYPAERFPELNFNQMVLKVLFTGVALERIIGLPARVTAELRRMANDYARERAAAGRNVPADIGRYLTT